MPLCRRTFTVASAGFLAAPLLAMEPPRQLRAVVIGATGRGDYGHLGTGPDTFR